MEKKNNYLSLINFITFSASCDQTFNSDIQKAGNFSSPGYPSQGYPSRIHCKYTFTGRGKERVQIIFTDFDLYLPDPTDESVKK